MDIKKVIQRCYAIRTEQTELKKIDLKFSGEIKDYFKNNNISELVSGDVQANVSITEKLTLNEEALIELLKSKIETKELSAALVRKIIRKKEYIDMEALENVLYKGKISPKMIAPCQKIDLTQRLTFKKIKD